MGRGSSMVNDSLKRRIQKLEAATINIRNRITDILKVIVDLDERVGELEDGAAL